MARWSLEHAPASESGRFCDAGQEGWIKPEERVPNSHASTRLRAPLPNRSLLWPSAVRRAQAPALRQCRPEPRRVEAPLRPNPVQALLVPFLTCRLTPRSNGSCLERLMAACARRSAPRSGRRPAAVRKQAGARRVAVVGVRIGPQFRCIMPQRVPADRRLCPYASSGSSPN